MVTRFFLADDALVDIGMALSRSADPCERNQNSNALIRQTAVDCYSSSAVEMAIKEKRKNLYKRWRFHLRLVSSHFLFLSLPESLAAHRSLKERIIMPAAIEPKTLILFIDIFLCFFCFSRPNACVVEEVAGSKWKIWTECKYYLPRKICGQKT